MKPRNTPNTRDSTNDQYVCRNDFDPKPCTGGRRASRDESRTVLCGLCASCEMPWRLSQAACRQANRFFERSLGNPSWLSPTASSVSASFKAISSTPTSPPSSALHAPACSRSPALVSPSPLQCPRSSTSIRRRRRNRTTRFARLGLLRPIPVINAAPKPAQSA